MSDTVKPGIHGRDHRRGGADPIPGIHSNEYARFQRISDSNITVLDATNVAVTGTSGQDVNTDSTIFQVNANSEIEMLVDALIGIWGQTVWNTYNTTYRQVSVFNTTPAVDVVLAEGGSSNDLYDPVLVSGIVRVAAGAKLKLVVNQHSGGGQSLYGAGSDADEINFLEVQYLGSYGS